MQTLVKILPEKIDEYENLLTGNPIFIGRLKDVGYLEPEDAVALGVTGPPLRASGVDWDLRRDMPYTSYEKFKFEVPTSNDGDVWARYMVRLREMRESVKICQQALDGMPDGPIEADAPHIVLPDREKMKTQMEALIYHFKIVTEGFRFRPARSTRPSNRRAARWATTPSGRHRETLPRPHAQPVLRDPAGSRNHVRRPAHRRRRCRHRFHRHRPGRNRPVSATAYSPEQVSRELWFSLGSLLRSYTAAHGLQAEIEAVVVADADRIMAKNGARWLQLERHCNAVTWTREDGASGVLELTDHGRLRGSDGEEEMDMAAEAWARELMQARR